MNVFTVHDQASNTYIPPFSMLTERDAIEGFKMVINDEGTPYNKYPGDYSLWKIADYDTRTGQLKPLQKMERVKRAIELVEVKNETL